jgi:hypothetical protein
MTVEVLDLFLGLTENTGQMGQPGRLSVDKLIQGTDWDQCTDAQQAL